MLSRHDAAWLAGWEAFYALEPFGSVREDFRFAQLGTAVVNNIPLRGRGAKAVKPADFFGTLRSDKPMSIRDMAAAAAAIVTSMGGETIKAGQEGGVGG